MTRFWLSASRWYRWSITIDAQHRLLGALKRADVDEVPCMIFESSGAADEAGVFLRVNGSRTGVQFVAKMKAMLVQKDPTALHVQRLVSEAGRTMSSASGPTTVACLSTIVRLHIKSPDVLASIWPIVIDLCRGVAIVDRIVDGLAYVEARLPEGTSLADKKWRDRILRIGPENLARSINAASSFYTAGGPRIWANGILEALNKGIREGNKLELAAAPAKVQDQR